MLLLPILALLGFSLWRQARGDPALTTRHDTETPPVESGETKVDGWFASFQLDTGGFVDARLTPLHSEPRRQAFDAEALAVRFGLGPRPAGRAADRSAAAPRSQPWRLSLHARAGAPLDAAPTSLALSAVSIAGLTPLGAPEDTAPRGATEIARDPISALFAPPRGALAAGEQVDLFFWGVDPADAGHPHGPRALSVDGVEVAQLLPTRLVAPRTSDSLARLDARKGTKEPR